MKTIETHIGIYGEEKLIEGVFKTLSEYLEDHLEIVGEARPNNGMIVRDTFGNSWPSIESPDIKAFIAECGEQHKKAFAAGETSLPWCEERATDSLLEQFAKRAPPLLMRLEDEKSRISVGACAEFENLQFVFLHPIFSYRCGIDDSFFGSLSIAEPSVVLERATRSVTTYEHLISCGGSGFAVKCTKALPHFKGLKAESLFDFVHANQNRDSIVADMDRFLSAANFMRHFNKQADDFIKAKAAGANVGVDLSFGSWYPKDRAA